MPDKKHIFVLLVLVLFLISIAISFTPAYSIIAPFAGFFASPSIIPSLVVAYGIAELAKHKEKIMRYVMAFFFLVYAFAPMGIYHFDYTDISGLYLNVYLPQGWLAVLLAGILILFGKLKLEKIISLRGLLIIGGATLLLIATIFPFYNYPYILHPELQGHHVDWDSSGSPIFLAMLLLVVLVSVPYLSIFTAVLLYLNKRQ